MKHRRRQQHIDAEDEVDCLLYLVVIIPHSGSMIGLQGRSPGAPTAAVVAAHNSYILTGWSSVQKYLAVLVANNGVLPVDTNSGYQG